MQLYRGSAQFFVQDSRHNAIADKLRTAFETHFRYRPSPAEVASWRNSLRAMSDILVQGELLETSVVLEYQLPLTSRRLDCMVLGRDRAAQDRAVVVELKQWEQADVSDVEGCVETWVGGNIREVLHPSTQVSQYRQYLEDCHYAFSGLKPIRLDACSYLHNATAGTTTELQDDRYRAFLDLAPVFCGDQTSDLVEHLRERTLGGDPGGLLERVTEERYRPSKALMDHVAAVIEDEPVYTLLDEQFVAFQSILSRVRQSFHTREKSVFIIHGGPGTGKSVLATNLVARLSKQHYTVNHATGSKAFTENLRKRLGSRASIVFNYFNNYTQASRDQLDVLVCDEAHRIRNSSNHRFTRTAQRSDKAQVTELIQSARVSVFFIDDAQQVRPGEVGSSQLIREEAGRHGAQVVEHELEAQFRCAGSDGFVNWIDNTLGLRKTANILWNQGGESFDFRIVGSVEELDREIRDRNGGSQSARLVAGYCWPWSKEKAEGGGLVEDVVIGDWRRPWNARPELTRLPPGVPKSMYWATEPGGIDQVGCIYTAQGFEFGYVGVIWGLDLRYDPEQQQWIGDPKASHDGLVRRAKKSFLDHVRHVYRVLLTRGLKGCYVHFMDEDTRRFVESRMDLVREPRPDLPAREERPVLALAAESPEAYRGLGKTGAAVQEAMGATGGLEALQLETDLIADLAMILERPDYADWRQQPEAQVRLIASVARLLRGAAVPADRAEDLAAALIERL